jgi:hypothetical protein
LVYLLFSRDGLDLQERPKFMGVSSGSKSGQSSGKNSSPNG